MMNLNFKGFNSFWESGKRIGKFVSKKATKYTEKDFCLKSLMIYEIISKKKFSVKGWNI